MRKISSDEITKYVKNNIQTFHSDRLRILENTNLKDLLRKKNPYLFKAKNVTTAQELIESFLDAKLSSSEEEIFGNFLESLAIFVAGKTLRAVKSSTRGLDIEYTKGKTRYIMAIKSGINWGNSSQWQALEDNFKSANKVLRQSSHVSDVRCVLGISYGNAKSTIKRGLIHQIAGQEFWYMISGSKSFYTDIVKPLGHRAKALNDSFKEKKTKLINRLTKEFLTEFCDKGGNILWEEVVEFNSGNLE
ncbi:Type II restriction endonuclease EcoO109I [uncultured archaeon]|nr:Type II restriction endonuclease EcoO109I [uncultured archaeon]